MCLSARALSVSLHTVVPRASRHGPHAAPRAVWDLGALCLCLRVLTYVRRLWVAETSSETHSPYLHFYVYSIKVKGREIYHMYTPEHRTDDERESRDTAGRQVARPNKPKAAILSLCLAHRSSAPAL